VYDHLYLDIYPPELQSPEASQIPSRQLMRPVTYSGPVDESAPLPLPTGRPSAPLVYVTMGTVFNDPGLFGSVVSAILSPYGWLIGTLGGVGAGLIIGIINGVVIVNLRILPFIATLATMLAANGSALLLAHDESVSVSYDGTFTTLGQGDFYNLPIPAIIAGVAYIIGSIVLNYTGTGRTVLAIGGNEDASRMMGLPVNRVKFLVYVLSGGLSGMAGVILASQFGAGQPIEGVGWELFAIASVVVGGTLLTGGVGSVGATLAGVMLLGLIFNVLNFENGLGWISLSAYWQSVIRGLFLLAVVIMQSRLVSRKEATA